MNHSMIHRSTNGADRPMPLPSVRRSGDTARASETARVIVAIAGAYDFAVGGYVGAVTDQLIADTTGVAVSKVAAIRGEHFGPAISEALPAESQLSPLLLDIIQRIERLEHFAMSPRQLETKAGRPSLKPGRAPARMQRGGYPQPGGRAFAILTALRQAGRPMKTDEVSNATGVQLVEASGHLCRLRDAGLVSSSTNRDGKRRYNIWSAV